MNPQDLKFWQQIMLPSKPNEVWPIVAVFIGLAAIVMIVRPKERGEVRTAGGLFGLSLVLLLASNACYWFALLSAGRFLHGAALLVGGVAVVNLLAALLFGVGVDFFRPKTPRILRDLCVALGYIGVVLWLLSRAGLTLSSIVTTSAVITAVIAFALQDTLGNIMGGLALQLEGTIRVGDWIRVDKTEGKVKELRWRHTTVETRNWDSVVIPNSVLMKGEVTLLEDGLVSRCSTGSGFTLTSISASRPLRLFRPLTMLCSPSKSSASPANQSRIASLLSLRKVTSSTRCAIG